MKRYQCIRTVVERTGGNYKSINDPQPWETVALIQIKEDDIFFHETYHGQHYYSQISKASEFL